MKKLFACALVAAGVVGTALAGGYDVYLLIGQSNMSGRGTLTPSNAVSNDRIVKFTKDMKWEPAAEPLHFDKKSCGAGLAMSFARKMADAAPDRTIALVPCAVGGTPLKRWCPGGDLYKNAVKRARAALKDGELKGILWHQGCFDSNYITNAQTYAARLVPMVARLRKDLGAPDAPFVAGELPRFLSRYVGKHGHHEHWPLVNAQLAEAVKKIPNAALVSSEGLDDCRSDLIHFETPSLRRFGERYADAFLNSQFSTLNSQFKAAPGAFDPKGGHIQGIAASEDALYVAQMTQITKLDWKGNVLAKIKALSHTGDIAWHDGELYAAVAVYPDRKEGRIQVYDKDLNLVRETTIDRTVDGITCMDGVLYVGMGAKEQPSSEPHRVNILGRFDARTLKEIAPRAEFDYGYETKFGFQNIVNDGGFLYASFYAVKGAPSMAVFDKSLKAFGTRRGGSNQGFDALPQSKRSKGARFVKARTLETKDPPSVSCEFSFFDFEEDCARGQGAGANNSQLARSDLEEACRVTKPMRTEANSKTVLEKGAEADFVVVGGGLSGICAAIAAARRGTKVILVQDRPMLGGNASSEMRMGIMGAWGDQNKEAGILEELQLRNFHYNPLMRYTIWDDVMLSAVIAEKNITLLLNTSVDGVVMDGGRIAAVKAWNSNAYTRWTIKGRWFADCSGDGILRLSGAKFRIGRELPEEFGEDFAISGGDHRTMGNSILLQLRKTEEDHPFIPPPWAYKFTDADFVNDAQPKEKGKSYSYKRLYPDSNNFWWVEFGGNLDTIGDANAIQMELKKIAYGVWAYMKNHPDGRGKNYDLDWIGALPGKRESTRFVGPHILTQHDVMSGGHFEDVVAYGGWTLDDHHPDAFWKHGHLSEHHKCPSPFGIPFDCLYSVNVPNLMFAGRDISCTHMGLSATRVMATCATLGQAVGTAAALLAKYGIDPAQLRRERIAELQAALEDDDCMLPFRWRKVSPLTAEAKCADDVAALKNGIDRCYDKKDNGVWVEPNEDKIVYSWDAPRRISGARIVFDSDMRHSSKRMRKLEATTERVAMPKMLAKGFRVDLRAGGEWRTVFEDGGNFLRFRKVFFAPVEADAMRLVVSEAWGGGKAHVFAMDAL
jgi:hypothetical protein